MDDLRFDIRISTRDRLLVSIRDFRLSLHQTTFLFGESGIGKSLIARAIYGLLDPEEFTVTINDEPYETYLARPETKLIKQTSFYVFQEPSSHLNPLMPLEEQVSEGNLSQPVNATELLTHLWEGTDEEGVRKLLEVYPKPYRPSGGEKQRVFLLMALKKMDILLRSMPRDTCTLFVFDEPTGSLDNHLRDVFLSLLFTRVRQSTLTILLITHDYSMVSEVTRSYPDLLDRISFREISLQQAGLTLQNFEPATYLQWLEHQKVPVRNETSQTTNPLLRVGSSAEVFGSRLIVSKDPHGIEACPLEIYSGTLVYLKAPSGTGKTTIVKMMMGLIHGEHLEMSLDGMVISENTPRHFWRRHIWGKKMTMVFQHADEALNPRSTVEETFRGLPGKKRTTREDIRQALRELFDIEISDEFLSKPVATLSGGQKQRINLMRGLFLDTDILILDEPLNGLDFESTTRVLALLRQKQQSGKGILLISHNEEIFDTLVLKEHLYYLTAKPVSQN